MPNLPTTLVSTFELLFTPQLPPGLGPPAVAQADELVVKGYFLTIANPNPNPFTFGLGFHCNTNPNPPVPQRTLVSAVAFLDDATTGTPLTIYPSSSNVDFSTSVTVSAQGTVLVGILPAFFNSGGLASPVIECRGYVDISLPALLRRGPGKFGIPFLVAQSNGPVNALVTAEQRLTFLPMSGDAQTAVEAQSAFALPLAAGQGKLTVQPQPGGLLLFDAGSFASALNPGAMENMRRVLTAPPEELSRLLGALLSSTPVAQRGKPVDDILRELGLEAPEAK